MSEIELNVPCLATLAGSSNSVAFHPTARLLAIGSDDRTVKLWGLSPNHSSAFCVDTLTGHSEAVTSVAFDPTGTLLASGSEDNTAKLWRLSPRKSPTSCVATLTGHTDGVNSVAFDPTGTLLATGSDDKTAKLWRLLPDNLEATTCVDTLEGHSRWVTCVAFHPTARLLATGSEDSTAKLWRLSADYSSATCVATLKAGRGEVTSLGFDPTGTVLATAGHNGTKLWDCRQFIRKNVTDDFRAMQSELAKRLVGDSVNGHMSMKSDILDRVALGNGERWLGVDPHKAARVNAHLEKLYSMMSANGGVVVPFKFGRVRHKKHMLLENKSNEDDVMNQMDGGSRARRSNSKSNMMKRKRTTLKRKSHK